MMNALLLAMAITGQTEYNLIVQENAPNATVRTPKGAYADPKVAALADARAKVRAAVQALADAQAEVGELTQSIAQEPPPRARIRYVDPSTSTIRETIPVIYEEVPVIRSAPVIRPAPIIRTVPRVRSALYSTSPPATYSQASPVAADSSCYSSAYSSAPSVTYSQAAPTTGTSCYSSAYSSAAAPSVYSTPMVSAPVTYSIAAPIIAAAPIAAFESGVTVSREKTRMGLFGRFRQNVRSTTYGSAVPTTFGAAPMTFAGGMVCVGGT